MRSYFSIIAIVVFVFICTSCDGSDNCWSTKRMVENSTMFGIGGCGEITYAFGSDDVDRIILDRKNGIWAETSIPEDYYCGGVWCSSDANVFMRCGRGNVLHYNGEEWVATKLESDYEYVVLSDIWGTGEHDVFVVGYKTNDSNIEGGYNYIAKYDGIVWQEMSTNEDCWLSNVWGTSRINVFATGTCGIMHYDGIEWKRINTGIEGNVIDIWGVSETSVYAVGSSVLHYDGDSWTQLDTGIEKSLNSIWGRGEDHIFASSRINRGLVVHYDGSGWKDVSAGDKYFMEDIWVSPSREVSVVGYSHEKRMPNLPYGVILSYTCK